MFYISILYNLSLFLLGVCIVTALSAVCYIIEIIKHTKNLEKIKIRNITYKKDY